MKKNNGFTLIELLAVIVILAIISIIAVPIVLNIIDTARRGSAESSANGYIDAVEYYNASQNIKGEKLLDGTYDVADLDVKIDGKKPAYGTVTIKKGVVESADICINGYIVEHKNNKSKSHSTCTGEADDVKPILTIGEIKKTTNRIEINFTAKDLESGIDNTTCEYGTTKDYGKTGKLESITNGPCIIENANQDTIYYYKITTIDKSKNETIVRSNTSTEAILKPVVTSDPNWSTNKVVNIEYKGTGIKTPAYFIKSTVNTTSDVDVIACNSTLPETVSECTGTSTKEITKDTWYLVSGTKINLTLNENGSIYTSTSDGVNMASSEVYMVTTIDKTEPELVSTLSVTTKTDRATLSMECSDESTITKYEFSKDEGKTWVNNGTSNSYTFKDLTQTTDYKFIGRCTNGSGLITASNKDGKTSSIIAPTISADTSWSTSKIVNIEYNGSGIETPVYFMKSTVNTTSDNNVKACTGNLPKTASECTGESTKEITKDTWYLVSGTKINLTLNENGSIYAYTSDGQNLASSNVYTVTTIDKTEPTLSIGTLTKTTKKITIPFTANDPESDIKSTTCVYGTTKDYGSEGTISGNSCVINNISTDTTYYYKITTTNNAGLIKEEIGSTNVVKPTVTFTQTPEASIKATSKDITVSFTATGITAPTYYIKSTINTTSNINAYSCGTSTMPGTCSGSATKNITANTWYKVTLTPVLTLTDNGSIYGLINDGESYLTAQTTTITSIIKNASEVYYNNSTFTNGEKISVQEALENLYDMTI